MADDLDDAREGRSCPCGLDAAAVERAASQYVNHRHPMQYDRGVGIVQGSHYRAGFVAGAVWQAEQARAALAAARDGEVADQHVTVVPVPGHLSRQLVLHAGGRVSWRDAPGYDLAAERAVLDEEPEVPRG